MSLILLLYLASFYNIYLYLFRLQKHQLALTVKGHPSCPLPRLEFLVFYLCGCPSHYVKDCVSLTLILGQVSTSTPPTVLVAGQLVAPYTQTLKVMLAKPYGCFHCGVLGHIAKYCFVHDILLSWVDIRVIAPFLPYPIVGRLETHDVYAIAACSDLIC